MTDESRSPTERSQAAPTPPPAGARVRRSEDPLAELARLIGQEDPFADFVANRPADARAGGPRRPHLRDARTHEPRGGERRRPPWRAAVDEANPGEKAEADPAPAAGNGRGVYAYGGKPAPGAALARPQPPRAASARQAPAFDEEEHIGLHEEDAQHGRAGAPAARRRAPQQAGGEIDEFAAADFDPDYDDEAFLPAHGDEFYDEAPRRRVRGWALVAIAAVAAIVVGTSGLFAYRAIFGDDFSAAPPRTIRSDAGPTKMVPAAGAETAETESLAPVRNQDRIGARMPQGERIVSREESPIDQSRIPQGAAEDRIPTGMVTAAQPVTAPPPEMRVAPLPQAPASTEPRRVRTVTVRADGTIVPNQPAPAAAAPVRAGEPMALQSGQGTTSASAGILPPPRPAVSTAAPTAVTPRPGDNPWAQQPSGGPASAPGQQAALPQPAPPPAPPPAVVVQTPAPAGSYVVQVAAQKTQADAQASWMALQQRFGNVLGNQQATIRRVDLGERGVFYRAQVGPFPTRAQASEVCQSLKAAGGDCVIQRN